MSDSGRQAFTGGEPNIYWARQHWYRQLGSHQELYDKFVESEARLGVLVRALRRVVKYRMTAKKAQETIEEALTAIGMAE